MTDVELYTCPGCAFTYDACHTVAGEQVCPVCAEVRLTAERDALRTHLAQAREALRWLLAVDLRDPAAAKTWSDAHDVLDALRATQPDTGDLLIANPIGSKISRTGGEG